jgi:hypothetical protein
MTMVTFNRYTEIAYEVADSKGFGDQLRGPGTQQVNQEFLRQLGAAYRENDHSEATSSEARAFLKDAVSPP